jgi:hypothetical protein
VIAYVTEEAGKVEFAGEFEEELALGVFGTTLLNCQVKAGGLRMKKCLLLQYASAVRRQKLKGLPVRIRVSVVSEPDIAGAPGRVFFGTCICWYVTGVGGRQVRRHWLWLGWFQMGRFRRVRAWLNAT